MGRPDNKWEDLTTNGKTRQQMGRPDKKRGKMRRASRREKERRRV
jgi:hypothetical protein